MATAAFKSSSRRSNFDKAPPKRRTQRSLSVSAVSRRSESDIDFLITRDNPLFLSTKDSPPSAEYHNNNNNDDDAEDKIETRRGEIEFGLKGDDGSGLKSNVGQRGRSISRNVDNRRKNGIGRSLSRGPSVHGGASESEVEQESATSTNYGSMNNSRSVLSNVRRSTSVRRGAYEYEVERVSPRLSNYQKTRNSNSNIASSDRQKTIRNQGGTPQRTSLQSVSSRHSVTTASDGSVTSLRNPSWDDGFSTGSVSEAEEKTIKAVCEQMKGSHTGSVTTTSDIYETVRSEVQRAISSIQDDLENSLRRSNATGIATADVTSIAPDSVKPGAVELVLDIRREYATKLEESQERARKLRSDLAVEEHRGQELSRILKETLPEPKVSTVLRSYPGRRQTSSERKRMSKRLTEEAMSYFDECVSISTFDSSDFSAAEDASVNTFRDARLVGSSSSLPEVTPCISATNGPSNCLNHKKELVGHSQLLHSPMDSVLTANISPLVSAIEGGDKNADSGRKSQFSLAREPTLTTGLQQEIKSYIKNSVVDHKDDTNSKITSYDTFNMEDYDLQGHAEGLLFDRVSYKNRIESGSLHLCTAGIGFSFSPFASVL